MSQTKIEAYIGEAREQGLTDAAIRQTLQTNGWTAESIDAGLQSAQPQSDKEYLAAVLFAGFLGIFGADRFYLGRYLTATLKLVTLGGLGIWALIDFFLILFGKLHDAQGRQLRHYQRDERIVKIAYLIFVISNLLWIVPYAAIGAWDTDYDTHSDHHHQRHHDSWESDLETT